MTNRMILNDPIVGNYPGDQRGWTGVQRQLANATLPGGTHRSLISSLGRTNVATSPLTAAESWSLDDSGNATEVSPIGSLRVATWYQLELQIGFGVQSAHSVPADWELEIHYSETATWDTSNHLYTNASGTNTHGGGAFINWSFNGQITTAGSTGARLFSLNGIFNSGATAGTLDIWWAQDVAENQEMVILGGSYLILRPALNLAEQSNP